MNGTWVSKAAMAASRVAVVSTGGTIASTRSSDADGLKVGLPISELLTAIGDVAGVQLGPVVDLARINSWNVDPSLMWRVASCVSRLVAEADVDGVVVTHGTDTIEETAFLVDVITRTNKPVVFTAAMRSADALSPDGPHNLTAALRAAGSQVLRGLGVTVCLDSDLHAARWVRKSHTHRTDAFRSAPGPVATVDPDGCVRRTCGPLARWTVSGMEMVERVKADDVPVIQAYTGMSDAALMAVVNATTPRGIVIEGFGLGHVPATLVDSIRDLVASGIVVVVTTRVPIGGAWPIYGGRGGGTDLAAAGVISAGGLSAAKARLLLLACLADQGTMTPAHTFQEAVAVLGRGSQGETP